jgi:uncharacterized integral membrane protein
MPHVSRRRRKRAAPATSTAASRDSTRGAARRNIGRLGVSSTPPTPGRSSTKRPWTPRRIVLGVIVVYLIIVVLANRNQVAVNFVFFKTEASLFVVLLLAIGLGFAAGWLFDDVRARRKRGRDNQ